MGGGGGGRVNGGDGGWEGISIQASGRGGGVKGESEWGRWGGQSGSISRRTGEMGAGGVVSSVGTRSTVKLNFEEESEEPMEMEGVTKKKKRCPPRQLVLLCVRRYS